MQVVVLGALTQLAGRDVEQIRALQAQTQANIRQHRPVISMCYQQRLLPGAMQQSNQAQPRPFSNAHMQSIILSGSDTLSLPMHTLLTPFLQVAAGFAWATWPGAHGSSTPAWCLAVPCRPGLHFTEPSSSSWPSNCACCVTSWALLGLASYTSAGQAFEGQC